MININTNSKQISIINSVLNINYKYLGNPLWHSNVSNLNLNSLFLVTQKVQDDIRYLLRHCSNNWVLHPYNLSRKNRKNTKWITIILESPHKNEYNTINFPSNMIPIRPANGRTGNRIDNFLLDILNNQIRVNGNNNYGNNNLTYNGYSNTSIISHLNINFDYQIIIMNPVQYQASLGSFYSGGLNSQIRDGLWKMFYSQTEENSFIQRVNLINGLDYIFNCCTGSSFKVLNQRKSSGNNLKRIVHLTLCKKISKKPIIFNLPHPIKWDSNTCPYY